jgi:glycosyltransferase involved in cell wall biosynthesis
MNLTILSTYPPRECGIASFSNDLKTNLELWGQNVSILAMNDNGSYKYPQEVVFELNEDSRDDYLISAQFVNTADIDAVFIEHEYGIFGGPDGEYVLDFASDLKKPFILNTHTVLPKPQLHQKKVLSQLGKQATAVICMTNRSAELLNRIYNVSSDKVFIVPHGVPTFRKLPRDEIKKAYGISGCPLVTTFGFIGPGKGIEIGINAVAKLKEKYPNIIYLVAGETHPNLKKRIGESYRDSLLELIDLLDMHNNIRFINRFISLKELNEILYMTDVYLTPYPQKNQAVSGTLAYAIGCGRAIVSTPYEYSLEVLGNKRGLVAETAAPNELSRLIDSILSNPSLKAQLESAAFELGKTMTWPQVGKNYVDILTSIISQDAERRYVKRV